MRKVFTSIIFIILCLCSGSLLAQIPTSGLIGFYPFNGNSNDESGTGNNGILHGPTLTEDRCGVPNSAYLFDGINDYIELDPDLISSNGRGTIAAWVKFNSLSRTQYLGCIADEQSIDYYISLLRYDPGSQTMSIFQRYPTYANVVTGSTQILPNVYYFLAMTADGNKWNLYVNGIRESLTTIMGSNTGEWASSVQGVDNWLLGCIRILQPYDQAFLDGTLDDIRFYNRALTDAEILQLYVTDCMALKISGDSIVCENQQDVSYSVPHIDDATYSWTYSGNDAVIEDNGNSILIDFGPNATGGTLSVTISGSLIATQVLTMDISVLSVPLTAGTISGLTEVCFDSDGTYTVGNIPGATDYIWSFSGSGSVLSPNDNMTSINFSNTATSGVLKVSGQNTCGTGPSSPELLITPHSCQISAITGENLVCQKQQDVEYAISPIDDVTYSWSYSGTGATISGNDNTVSLSFNENATSGILTVTISGSLMGIQASSFYITVLSVPAPAGSISGLGVVCLESGENYSIIPIPGVIEYQWHYTGSGITQSGSSSVINIYFSETASMGTLTVTGLNSCGSGESSPDFLISPKSCKEIEFTIPNSFTPNGDGTNDMFYIEGLKENSSLSIYDRNGRLLFSSSNYLNDWNGKDENGTQLESNTYWYVLEIPGYPTAFKGYIYLKR